MGPARYQVGRWVSEGQKVPGLTLLQLNWPSASAAHASRSPKEKYTILNEPENNGAISYLISLYVFVFQSYSRILLMPAVLLPCAYPWLFGNALYINALYIMHFITCICSVINISFHLSPAWASAVWILLCCDLKTSFPVLTSEISSAQHRLCHQHHSSISSVAHVPSVTYHHGKRQILC